MTLHIKGAKADRLARALAKATGESLTDAVTKALQERYDRVKGDAQRAEDKLFTELMEISNRAAKGFRNTKKSARELVNELYDEDGLPR
jgi:antitoxin VapB